MRIERVTPDSVWLILPLVSAYQRFYQAEPDEHRNRKHFSLVLGDPALSVGFVALDDNALQPQKHGTAVLGMIDVLFESFQGRLKQVSA